MALLRIVTFCSFLSLGSTSSCLSTESTDSCSDFTTKNDPILTSEDSCSPPPNSNKTVKQCGQGNISHDDCYRAGCCYQEGQCFVPFVQERVDFLFFQEKVTFWEAYRQCRNSGLYKLPCVVDTFDYKRVKSRSCGNVWLGGAITDRNAAIKVPFYNQSLGDCSSKIGVTCKLFPRSYALALQPGKDDTFFLTSVDTSDRRPFICIKEQWRPHITDYPGNVASEDPNKIMICGLIFSGNVTTQNLAIEWRLIHPNGTAVRLKNKVYKDRQQVAAQYYADSIKSEMVGKYICNFSFLDKEGLETERTGWAYHYTDISCNVTVQGVSYSEPSLIELAVEYNSDISVRVFCSGYPLPKIFWTDDVNGYGHVTRETVQNGDKLPISKLEAQAPLHEEVTYTVKLQPKSDITTLPTTTIRITKLPILTECYVTLITEEEHVFEFSEKVVQRTVKTGASFDVIFECFGFPKPNMTIVKTAQTKNGPLVEDLSSDIYDIVGQWFFENFAVEVAPTEEYEMTLNMTVTPAGETPSTLTLLLTKETIPTSCSFRLINNGAEIHEHTAFDVQDFHRVNESSFSGESFELAVSCSGFPPPEITAVISSKREGSDPTEMKLGPFIEYFDWKLNSFASEATVAQDFSQTVTMTARSGDHAPVIMVVNLVKTIIMFAMEELPNDTRTVTTSQYGVEDEEGAILEQVASNQIELPCKGASGPGFPTPSAFWEYNDHRLDLTSEMGKHIEFKNHSSEVDSTIIVSTLSSIVAGLYRCVILIDNKFTKNYTTTIMMERPPVAPGQTVITRIEDNRMVVAASSLQPSYQYLGNVSFKGFLYSDDVLKEETSNITVSEGKVYGVFNLPESGVIKVGFTASNEFGESEMSQKSDELKILSSIPSSSVSTISRDGEAGGEAYSSLSLTFDQIPHVDEYEVKLYGGHGALIKVFRVPENRIDIEDLEPQTSYSVKVRGVNMIEGERVYGPSSLASSFTTAPRELPAPSNLQGRPLESEGNKSAVLLTWDVVEVGAEFIDGYLLSISLAGLKSQETTEGRRKRQALQSVKTVRIPFGARAKVIKDLNSGTSYEFVLQSYSSDFGESEPAKVTVQTLTAGPCPYTLPELYPPRHCPPRVSIDRKYLYIKFYFDCYSGQGFDFRGKHSTTHRGECAPWTEDNLKQFQNLDDLPEIGTNYCRNMGGSRKNNTSLHDSPWCFLSDGSNETCSLRQCHPIMDDTCYTETGENFQGQGYSEQCVTWTETVLKQNLLLDYPQKIIGSTTCKNWDGTNMTKPWCFTADGFKAECPVPPCGSGEVTVTFGQSELPPRSYIVNENQDSLCVKLEGRNDVEVGVKHTFGVQNCQSDEIFPEVIIPSKTRLSDRMWVRYLIVELVLTVLVGSLWLFLLYRRRIISKQSTVTNGRTSATNLNTRKGTSSTRLSYSRTPSNYNFSTDR
ncbi:hypothetical protein ACHWQZ_G016867 [Mnemiopsis leidyi]